MIHFAYARYLLLIFLIPVFFIVQAVLLRIRRNRLRKFGDEKLVSQMMPSYSKSKVWVRLVLFSIGFFFFVIGLSRPQIGARLKEQEIKGAEIIIAIDVSNSMLAEDYSPNRLERAKLAVSRLVDKLSVERFGMVIFSGTSFVQLPVTTDYVSSKMFLNSIDTGSIPIQGTALGDAITTCIRSFSEQSDKSRAIILITDGENHEDDPVAAAKQAAEMGIKVFAIGVGSPEGKPIPMNGELLKDKDGEIVVSRLDEAVLQEIAAEGNGAYVRAGNSEFGLNPIIDDLRKLEDEKYSSVVFEEYDEQFMYFLAIALVFFVLEMLVVDIRSKRHLFQR